MPRSRRRAKRRAPSVAPDLLEFLVSGIQSKRVRYFVSPATIRAAWQAVREELVADWRAGRAPKPHALWFDSHPADNRPHPGCPRLWARLPKSNTRNAQETAE